MTHPLLAKDPAQWATRPNLVDYAGVRPDFDWAKARALLDGLPGGCGLNIAPEAVDRHADGPRAERVALRWLGKSGARREFTYRDLAAVTNRFANALSSLDVGKGDRVFILLGRVPELYIAVLGALKAKCAFGPEPIATRLEIGDARVLVTTEALYRRKVEGLRSRLPMLEAGYMAATAVEAWDERWATPEGRADWLMPHSAVAAPLPVLKARGTQHVPDLGCGVGRHALLFAEHGVAVEGIDGAPAGLDFARREAAARGLRLSLRQADADALPFQDESFD